MAGTTKIKAKLKNGVIEVKALASHPMLSYQEAERAKKEANFITYVVAKVGDKVVYEASTSQFLSKDPYLKFSFTGANAGDVVELTWKDLKGNTDVSSEKIK
ncbi:MAG: thiosulfate oxidation carrier complex protein SoxZ [Arcobacter sp.]|jgi:sulfur-oxidizing protein SoxZ|uniref:Sulfur oxidation protein SoxYZ, sulfur compound chelating protein n=1 Tax=Arcobacter defluvii TaxID=873191 RepID=A0AAE7BCS7_9BACT|nr:MULTISPECIES: thiosulfate oxidation carrier complex protein SoxZ [Arcobacter]MDY3200950.1 thiosulfate oxidation carrier complex protein SoxZ [Arcobacter sp.]QKF76753.1 sulfur oxidation protein SoxYZ, sulfur compound chelating protein [Arcobacter defluvii]RXI34894.1 thiosulfate oxidation carrier complex protein SoxZ [Arcobacter defluvii]BAK72565.1 sulfur oxidation protein SoxZ [Arcobacter sp. L]